jgi:hypothetical protein
MNDNTNDLISYAIKFLREGKVKYMDSSIEN